MKILGIDSSPSNCGWCCWDTAIGAKPVVGIYHPGKYGDNNLLLIRDTRKWGLRMIDELNPDSVWIESVTPSGNRINPKVWTDQISVTAGIDTACEMNNMLCYQAGPGQWLKRFTGNGGGGTEERKIRSLKRAFELGVLTDVDHISDAVGICEFGMAAMDKEYLRRTEADRVRRELAVRREAMQDQGKPITRSKLFKEAVA